MNVPHPAGTPTSARMSVIRQCVHIDHEGRMLAVVKRSELVGNRTFKGARVQLIGMDHRKGRELSHALGTYFLLLDGFYPRDHDRPLRSVSNSQMVL
jgi:hypothetical protein